MNIAPNIMGITNNHNLLSDFDTTNDPIEKIITKYQNHPSITSINKDMTHPEPTFSFQTVTKEQMTNLIRLLNNKKQYSQLIYTRFFITSNLGFCLELGLLNSETEIGTGVA